MNTFLYYIRLSPLAVFFLLNLMALWFFAVTMDNFCGTRLGFSQSSEDWSWFNYLISDIAGFNLFLWTVVLTIKLYPQSVWQATVMSLLPWLFALERLIISLVP